MVAAAHDHAKALNAATLFELDDVIDPADTRRVIAATLAAAGPRTAPRRGRASSTPGDGQSPTLGGMAIRVDYVGHASVRIEVDGVRFLTDPVLRPRVAHLRRISPAAHPDVLEGIDVVLISHAHMDHLDVRSLRGLPGSPRVICPGPARRPVARAGWRPPPWTPARRFRSGRFRIEVVAADHDGRRWPLLSSGDSVGFVLRGSSGAVYFAGDTGLYDAMSAIQSIDLALIPVAGWGPSSGPVTSGPETLPAWRPWSGRASPCRSTGAPTGGC